MLFEYSTVGTYRTVDRSVKYLNWIIQYNSNRIHVQYFKYFYKNLLWIFWKSSFPIVLSGFDFTFGKNKYPVIERLFGEVPIYKYIRITEYISKYNICICTCSQKYIFTSLSVRYIILMNIYIEVLRVYNIPRCGRFNGIGPPENSVFYRFHALLYTLPVVVLL